MHRPSALLRYHGEDRILRDVEDLSRHGRISRSFIRMCVELGCPESGGRLSLAMLLDWLFDHYAKVRLDAGLPELAPVDDLPESVQAKLQMGNAMITLLEYSETRATDQTSKQRLRLMKRCVERALDY